MVRRNSRGFTLVELLVVITIIGILMALLLPAVQMAVEAARRGQCLNQMRQIGVACVNFDTSKNRFPGYTNKVGAHRGTWIVAILPNLERQDVYDQWELSAATAAVCTSTSPGTVPLPLPYIDFLVCPSDPPDANSETWNSYVGNAGFADATNVNIANGILHNHYPTKDGATKAARGPSITSTQITDGISNTLLISENIQADYWNKITDDTNSAASDKIATVFVWHATGTSPEQRINGLKNNLSISSTANYARPSSNHPGGVNVCFADGHSAWLRQDIDYQVYQQLMTTRNTDSNQTDKTLLNGNSYQ